MPFGLPWLLDVPGYRLSEATPKHVYTGMQLMIYKYFAPSENALSNLRTNSLFLRHFSLFNDPFEFWAIQRSGIPQPRVERERFAEAMRAWGFSIDDEWEAELYEEYFKEVHDYQPNFRVLYEQARITCFCSDARNLLMWSHYGDGMRGFCAAYDAEPLSRIKPEADLIDVHYSAEVPTVDSFLYAIAWDQYDYHMMAIEEGRRSADVHMEEEYEKAAAVALDQMHLIRRNAFATKPAEWAYEKEKRLVVHASNQGLGELIEMHDGTLREIIVGERMDGAYRQSLERAVSQTLGDIPVTEARRVPESFRIRIH